MLRKVFSVVAIAALLVNVACGTPTGSSSTTAAPVTVTPSPSTPAMGESRSFELNLPYANVVACLVMVRQDAARYLLGCISGPTGSIGVGLQPNTAFTEWGRGQRIDAEVLVANAPAGTSGSSIFGWQSNVNREKADHILSTPLNWSW